MQIFGPSHAAHWRERLHEVIFEAETRGGKLFDIALLLTILVSVAAVMAESVASIDSRFHTELRIIDLVITGLFTVEFVLRLLCVDRPWRYTRSFFGVVDLLSILPGILSLFLEGTQSLLVVRTLRLLRVFRVLKLGHYVGEAEFLLVALKASRRKITVFLGTVLSLVVILGALMYLIEGADAGFTSIPTSIYWAIVTMTTVGYGDIAPQTVLGQFLASAIMISGYGIIAVPTGIVSVELAAAGRAVSTQVCKGCLAEGHDTDARFCKHCGYAL
ncbi:ion transporter [Haliangium ochraceum]|uniref:Ion transport protein n=1 Tax=Haliangium ochraceum (strain DSM 14365 / JCM 11303 / SMP-2) TaxID=502025 RepID=D0LT14_HALO1|nr:ion transporter [Haliangium ochraceum]ACY19150.1 Ion transport protein [Haliangium ochraceum DSM 14365]